MSRSYKKHPWWKCCPGAYTKKMANRRLRRYLNSDPNVDWPQKGNLHRKYTESWEINDYIFDGSWERFKEWNWVREKYFDSEQEAYNHWKKYYRSK